jgi:hypothetical protein
MKEQHPTLKYALLFQRDNWMTKDKKGRYSDWAIKHGIPYAVGIDNMPKEWVQ